jgi:predicted phosphate transport protein (TIGR00153 family)
MLIKFFPKEVDFFELFNRQIACAVDAATCFQETITNGEINEDFLSKLSMHEHNADNATYQIISQLNKTFITPFDREDIHSLALEIDNIVDMLTTITNRLVVYKIKQTNKNLVDFSKIITDSVKALASAIKLMDEHKNAQKVVEACLEVARLENVGDSIRDRVLAELFETEKDFIAVIKWKEIYEDAETVLDICEDVAHAVSNILVKHS